MAVVINGPEMEFCLHRKSGKFPKLDTYGKGGTIQYTVTHLKLIDVREYKQAALCKIVALAYGTSTLTYKSEG